MKLIKRILNPLGITRRVQKNPDHLIHPKKTSERLRKLGWKGWLRLTGKSLMIFLFFLVILFIWYSKDLPAISKLKSLKTTESTQILDRNGELLYAISGEKQRMIIPSDQIPEYIKQATVVIEDENFYKHHGWDFRGIFRATYRNLIRGHISEGGSTITQQYVKNALLTPKRTLSRKIKELILSIELEFIYPKEKILELYLNEIPYGSTSYGIEAAAHRYFDKKASELTLEEGATLAALPQAPTYYSPYGPHKDKLLVRKDTILNKMAERGYITQQEAEEAKRKKISFVPPSESLIAPHFVFYIRQYLADKYGEKMLERGGLKVTTTLDIETQKKAREAIDYGSKRLKHYGANNAALVAVEPSTGQILAMVGSIDYFDDDIDGQVNVTTARRQPGSSFKPIVYATAFKEKYNPAFTLFDLTTDFGNYTPDNYDGRKHGPVTMRFALANSLNIPAVKTLALTGLRESIKTASDLGITTLTQPNRYGLALVLGGGEVKPLEMAGAFGVFGHQGVRVPVTGILKIEDGSGNILEEFKEEDIDKTPVLDPQIAYQINHILSDNNARTATFGSRNYLTVPGHKVAVKTGTTQEYRDAWTIGYTTQISTAVWVGNTDNTKMKDGAAGSVVAAPIWRHFMKNYLKGRKNLGFERPSGIQEIEVDKLSNKLPTKDSPEKITDIFASWQVPTEQDDIHIRVKINRLNNKLATDITPDNLIEEKLYTKIHSAQPEKPNWENPVQAWARENGMDNPPPTEKDDMYTSLDQLPVVEITSPLNNAQLSGTVSFSANAQAHFGIEKVVFSIDNVQVAEDDSSPYSADYNVSNLSEGSHTLTVFGVDKNGAQSYQQIDFKVVSDTQGPSISSISVTTTASTATINFITDKPSLSYIQYGTVRSNLSSKSLTEPTPYTNHSLILSGLPSSTLHYFKIVSRDEQNNSTSSPIYSFVTK
jgi:1A family penicillin-binding protein